MKNKKLIAALLACVVMATPVATLAAPSVADAGIMASVRSVNEMDIELSATDTFTSGDWEYIVRDDGSAAITGYIGENKAVVIPSEIDGIAVTEIFRIGKMNDEITSLYIPEGITYINCGTFNFCTALTQIEVAEGNMHYSAEGCMLFDKDKTKLLICTALLEEYTVPDSVKVIGERAFYCSNISRVNLPEGLISIEENAFEYCGNLKSINLPYTLTSIGEYAFFQCYRLKSITIPANVKNIGDYAFCASGLNEVVLSEGVENIGGSAFGGCEFKSLTIPASVKHIGDRAFAPLLLSELIIDEDNEYYSSYDNVLFNKDKTELIQCSAKKQGTYVVPESVTHIKDYAFLWCEELTEIVLPEGLIEIGDAAFNWCDALEKINIPASVTNIGDYVFNLCAGLAQLAVAEDNAAYCAEENVIYNKDKTILICCANEKEGEIIIPESVNKIEERAFAACDKITKVTVPEGVEGIESQTFYECRGLEKVTLPEGLTFVGDEAFYWCENLDDINFPPRITRIGEYAFSCTDVGSYIELPVKLEHIGFAAFSCCEELYEVIIPDGIKSIDDAFDGCSEELVLSGKAGGIVEEYALANNIEFRNCNYVRFGDIEAYAEDYGYNEDTNELLVTMWIELWGYRWDYAYANVYIAVYNENDEVLAIEKKEVISSADVTEDIIFELQEKPKYIKTFITSGFDGISPIYYSYKWIIDDL